MKESEPVTARRARSRRLLLEAVRTHGALSRSELSRSTGLARSAVAHGVQGLLDEGLLEERLPDAARRTARRGRPSALLVPSAPPGWVAAIDFGHAHVSVAIADTVGDMRAELHTPVDVDGRAIDAFDTATAMFDRAVREVGIDPQQILAVCAGVPGPVDGTTGQVRSPTILASWVDVDPARELGARLGRRVHIANDADMGAHGELRFGAATGARDFLYIKASHGIGAGLVLDGRTYRGSVGIAGEIGHTQLGDGGAWCRCGNRGCLETVVSSTQVRRQLAHVLAAEGDEWPTGMLENPVALRILTTAGRTIGRVIADLCNCLNPSLVVIGGDLGTIGVPVVSGVRESLDQYAQPATAATVDVRAAALGQRAELVGAMAYAIDTLTLR
ncbi:ROK family protein [Nocardioidaceae bacterium SCSIO 66511]|nr:ROK family protein [Nocardioidaceae bacterium SCSIO 66511]